MYLNAFSNFPIYYFKVLWLLEAEEKDLTVTNYDRTRYTSDTRNKKAVPTPPPGVTSKNRLHVTGFTGCGESHLNGIYIPPPITKKDQVRLLPFMKRDNNSTVMRLEIRKGNDDHAHRDYGTIQIQNILSQHPYATLKCSPDIQKLEELETMMNIDGETGITSYGPMDHVWKCFFPNRKPGSFFSYDDLREFDKNGRGLNTSKLPTEMHFVKIQVLTPGDRTPEQSDDEN